MGETQTLILGFVAGATILIGLPVGRLRAPMPGTRLFLNSVAIGILTFLLWDVLAHAWEPVDGAIGAERNGTGGIGPVAGYGAVFFAGFAVGLLSLAYYEKWLGRPVRERPSGPGSLQARVLPSIPAGAASWSPARRLAVMIAVGIGLHNFGEGLAIGGSAAAGEISLATILVIGFGLHNATEGFGIVAPLAAGGERPSWTLLLTLGLIGGGPTFAGTVVGRQFTSEVVSTVFLTLAAGSILYVIVQLVTVAARAGRKDVLCWGMLLGITAGFVTDAIVTLGGA